MTTSYLIKDFIYEITLQTLYNVSREWLRPASIKTMRVDNPHKKHTCARLYYRPAVENYILQNQSAYEAKLHLRLARLNDEQGVKYQAAHDRIQTVEILTAKPPTSLEQLITNLFRHNQLYSELNTLPPDWQPNPADLFLYYRFAHTTYVQELNNLRCTPGAGFLFLNLRHKADHLVAQQLAALTAQDQQAQEQIHVR